MSGAVRQSWSGWRSFAGAIAGPMPNASSACGAWRKPAMSSGVPRLTSSTRASMSCGHGKGASITVSCISFMAAMWPSWSMRSPKRVRSPQRISSGRSDAKPPLNTTQNGIRMQKKPTKATTTNALKILDRITGDDPALRALIEEETLHAHVARMIYEARTQAGLTQQELARLVGTKQPVIARLEDADYDGHSLSMLQRIATALHQRLEIHLVPDA